MLYLNQDFPCSGFCKRWKSFGKDPNLLNPSFLRYEV
jgi:hypothetical protein